MELRGPEEAKGGLKGAKGGLTIIRLQAVDLWPIL